MRETFLPFGRPSFGPLEEEAVLRVLRSGWVGMGPETILFENELAAYLDTPQVVTVNSCTSALFLSLLVSGVGSGDEVIVPSMTWCSSANAALYLGARPVFCDVDRETICASWETIEPHITGKTRAVIVVHFGGAAADTRTIREKLPPHIALVEDAAHALGSSYRSGGRVGSEGNLTCFSFYANKNLSTGDGGAVAVADGDMAARLRSLRLHALPADAWKRFQNKQVFDMGLTELGYKMNLGDLQSALGRVQLQRQEEFRERRMVIVKRYQERLPEVLPGVALQGGWEYGVHAAHLFVVMLPIEKLDVSRDEFLVHLREKNIGASLHYAPLHRMPLYGGEAPSSSLPVTEHLAERILTLPISASMSLTDADDVLDAIANAV